MRILYKFKSKILENKRLEMIILIINNMYIQLEQIAPKYNILKYTRRSI